MARVELKDVNKIYGGGPDAVHAVKDLDLTIEDGEFMALLGPSGCGKTSTLRMIVGLESITGGTIAFDGRRVNELDPQGRNVAMAFETYALYPNFTIEENLAFPLEVRGVSDSERRRKAREIAEMLKLTDILDQKPGQLSGGQQQRVSLGRALIRDPAVFILDEVMSHVDAHLKFQMMFDLKAIHREIKRTMVYVTHDQVEALALADRVAVMSNALLQQVGSRNELYHRPANVFVADFIGEPPTNFFDAEPTIDGHRLSLRVSHSNLTFNLAADHARRVAAHGGSSFTIGIRPQSLRIAAPKAKQSLEAEVRINEYLGEQSILTMTSGVCEFRALVPPETAIQPGEPVRLAYDPKNVMVFDTDSQKLIA